jgi:PAS domain S-box-containing protein
MPAFFWLDIAVLSLSAVVAASLGLIALASSPKHLLNVTFTAFAATEATWAVLSLLLRLSLWLGKGNPVLLSELLSIIFGLLGPTLLLFVVRYVGSSGRWADPVAYAGIAVIAGLSFPVFKHLVVSDPQLTVKGSTILEISTLGLVVPSVPVLLATVSLVLFWKARRRLGEPYLPLSVLILLVGFVAGGILELPFPILSVTNTVSVCLLGYGISRRQLFNPLRKVTAELEKKVDARTRELGRAYEQLEERVEERTTDLQREIGERQRAEAEITERALRLELMAEIGKKTTAILSLDDLMHQAVNLIRDTFNYYKVAILIVEGEEVVLRAVTLDSLKTQEGRIRLRVGLEGITGWVAANGEELLVSDVEKEPRYYAATEDDETKSELAVPIKLKGEVIGVLDSHSLEPDAFSDVDVFTLKTVADQLAVAIENARLYEETQRRADRLGVVNRVAAAVGASLKLNEQLETIYREVNSIFQIDAFLVALYNEDAEELDYRILIDEGVREPLTKRPLGSGLASRVVAEKRSLLFEDLEERRDQFSQGELWGTGKLPRSWLGVPMLIGDRITGVISLQCYRPRVYGEEERLLLSTIADQVALAVERARLYEEVHQELGERKRAEEVLRESEEKFRNLAEQSPSMIFINANGRVVYANRKCEEMMGYRREEFYSPDFDFRTLITPEYIGLIKQSYLRHSAGEEVKPYEYALVTKQGKKVEVIITTKLIKYEGQNAILGIITDITARKKTERLLKVMNAAALAMGQALVPQEIFSAVGREFAKLGFNTAIYLTDDEKSCIKLESSGIGKAPFSIPIDSVGVLKRVIRKRQTVLVKEPKTIGKILPEPIRDVPDRGEDPPQTARLVLAPLMAESDVVGLLAVHASGLSDINWPLPGEKPGSCWISREASWS